MKWTVQKIISWSQDYLQGKGVENPRLDVELLLEEVLGISRIRLYTEWDRPLDEEELKKFKSLLKRRVQREPLAYILGRREFYSLGFKVNSAVLVPRPETEELVEFALDFLKEKKEEKIKILDLCTGSGCILISLLKNLPQSEGVGIDFLTEALAVAQENAAAHQVQDRTTWIEADLLQDWPAEILSQKFDLITANPPYIPESEWTQLQEEVQFFEPKSALISGPHGTDVYAAIFENLKNILASGALFIGEMGEEQSKILSSLAHEQLPDIKTSVLKDLSGKERFFLISNSPR
ncbi:MAG: peptide chain release factor N(5)-glutamine methyltransferase [Deltaproteobacteria bacterium]|nr:peptide chain release factor N(5)-glutamine methyltransferase [Deltaproteobacteria bacterium]